MLHVPQTVIPNVQLKYGWSYYFEQYYKLICLGRDATHYINVFEHGYHYYY